MYGKYKYRNKRARRRAPLRSGKKTIKKAIRTAKRTSFARRVRQVINRISETKLATYSSTQEDTDPNYTQGMPIVNTASADHDVYIKDLGPSDGAATHSTITIFNGDHQGDRTGNMITTCGARITGVIRFNNTYDATLNHRPIPVYICMWIVSLKKHMQDQVSNLENVIQSTFFQNGNSARGFTGLLVDLTQRVNQDQVTLHKRRVFKLGASEMTSWTSSGGANSSSNRWMNNDFSQCQMFNINLTSIIPKKFRFNDDVNQTPINQRRRWMFFTTHRIDNITPTTSTSSTTGPVQAYVDWNYEYRFKDI